MDEIRTPDPVGQPHHRHEGHDTGPPTKKECRRVATPNEPTSNRTTDFQFVPDDHLVMHERRNLAFGQALHSELYLVGAIGG